MATIITNRATVNYRYGTVSDTAVSNVTSTVLNGPLNIEKNSLTSTYRFGSLITYLITVSNPSSNLAGAVTVTDNLGSFVSNGNTITPLTFVGPASLFINGEYVSDITPIISANRIRFTLNSIPAGGNVQIMYQARVNNTAPLGLDACITNTSTVTFICDCPCETPASDSHTVCAEEYADVRITKSVCPNPVICGDELTYVIDVYNYGTIPATNVILTDTFVPPLTDISVTVDGVLIPATDYDYIGGTLTLPNETGDEITIPAATFSIDSETGEVLVEPGHVQIIITGTI